MKYLLKVFLLTLSLLSTSLFFGQQQTALAEFDCNTVSEMPISECEALVSLYGSTNGESWWKNVGWLISNTPCDWYGISCLDGHVIDINLHFNTLTGSIPAELGNLTNLQNLDLYDNLIAGSIPAGLGNMTNLIGLYLSLNKLTGTIPAKLGNLTKLQALSLYGNQLIGSIPNDLMNLITLHYLSICGNYLYTANPDLRDYFNRLQPGWENCQTPPFVIFKPIPWMQLLLLDD